MNRKRYIMATLAALLAVPAYVSAVAPSTEAKFLNALGASKLQYPNSSTDADAAALLAGHDEVHFTLSDTDKMTFTHDTVDERSELRNLHNWHVNTTVQTAHANVAVISQAADQVTIMQIHDDANTGIGTGPNKPLIRIFRDASDGKIWAIIKNDATGATNLPTVDLGSMALGTYFDCDITVDNGTLTVAIDSVVKVNAIDVSYWSWPSYWKAGLYLQDSGATTVRFNELTWPGAKALVDDDFADADLANTGALQADWWSSNSTGGNSTEIATNALGLVSGGSGRGLHGTFTPQNLAIGETLTSTITFTTPATVGSDKSGAFKVALMDFNNAGLAADLDASGAPSNPLYEDLPGYFIEFDVNKLDNSEDITIRKHDVNTTGRFLAISGEWSSLGDSADVGYDFAANTEYVAIVSVTRTGADTMDVFGTLLDADGTVLDSHAEEDASSIANHFGMLGVWANGGAFGSVTTADPDNGITISNVTVELVNLSANQAPAFTFNSIDKADATIGVAYSGSLAGDASDFEGDAMTFSKTAGPAWLTVAANGDLGGTPPAGEGLDVFTVQVADAGGSNTATLNITVAAASPVLVNDSFADADRTKTGSLDANWWSSSDAGGNSIEVYAGQLGLVSGTSGRGIHGTFTPQTLAVGDSLTATLTFTTPVTVGSAQSGSFRFALMDLNNAGLEADLNRPNVLYQGLPGYMINFDVNKPDATDDIEIREHNVALATGNYLSTTNDWITLGSSGDADYAIASSTEYVVVIEVERTGADSMDITATLSQTGVGQLDTHTASDTSVIVNNFGMLGIWANSNNFGSTTTHGAAEDNGITFSNITIEVDGGGVVNQAPAFSSNPITELNATYGVAYSGNTLADDASDLEGDTMTFTKTGGPAWLSVATDGTLSGTPLVGNLGLNVFTVQVDATGGSDTATLNITVDAPFAGGTLFDDNFADDNLAATGTPDPLDADWWGTSGTSAIEIDPGVLGLRSGTSGRGLHGTFAPQTLDIGDSMTATMSFTTPATVGSNQGAALKFALMDFNNAGLAANTFSSSSTPNPLFQTLPGYMIDFDVNDAADEDNIVVREHQNPNASGRFLGTTTEWDELGSGPAVGYEFLANTDYVVVLTLTRTNTGSMDIFASLSLDDGAELASFTASDIDGTIANNFGMLGAWVNSNTFGSTNGAGVPDNGIDFTNIKVETALDNSGNVPPVASDNSGSIDEDALVGDDVLTVAASDDSAISSYAITAGNTGDAFSIDSAGLIEVAAGLDFATTPSYTLTVTVTDDGTPGLKDTAQITITVNEVVSNTNQSVVSDALAGTGGPFDGETDLAIIGVGADPDGDGNLNFMEVWQGTDAGTNDSPTALVLGTHTVGTVRGSVIIETASALDDLLAIDVEATHDLTGSWRVITANRDVISDAAGVRTLRFYDTIELPSGSPFFIRFTIDPDAAP
ncbi:MAG: polysaccharide lyase family 7 protein [Opitutales bacterium]|nr:polysaccharide lyase family 7 protein [Opitutales bacterium]MDP5079836.1 polysaccharide lyase family 7 protein [Opitutales bacterium]